MTRSEEVRDFLSTRRARITPEAAGLPNFAAHRRVPGLRREEVAMLAGVSVEYYTKLERGNLSGASESVLNSLAGALQLTREERDYFFLLAKSTSPSRAARRSPNVESLRANLQHTIDLMTGIPVYVRNSKLDILGLNALGKAVFPWAVSSDGKPRNTARFVFLNDEARNFFPDWQKSAEDAVSILRMAAVKDPYDRALTDLIGELSTRSEDFRQMWARHNIGRNQIGQKHFFHPIVGALTFNYEALSAFEDPDLVMLVYTPAAGSPEVDKLLQLSN